MSTTVELHRKDAELQAVRAELVALRAGVEALTWFPATRDTVSGQVSPPRRKTHVRVRDIDAALALLTTDAES